MQNTKFHSRETRVIISETMLSPPVIRKPRPQNYVFMPRTGGIIIIIITLEIITCIFIPLEGCNIKSGYIIQCMIQNWQREDKIITHIGCITAGVGLGIQSRLFVCPCSKREKARVTGIKVDRQSMAKPRLAPTEVKRSDPNTNLGLQLVLRGKWPELTASNSVEI